MNSFRGKKIAHHFSGVAKFHLQESLNGVTIIYMGNQTYFEDEHDLWNFLIHIAHASHQK